MIKPSYMQPNRKQLRDTDLWPNWESGVGLTGLVLVRSAWV